jgi:N-acetylmuramoyl-L-alanine amidase
MNQEREAATDKALKIRYKFTILRKGIANRLNIVSPVRIIGITALFLAITLLNSSTANAQKPFKVKTIVIDAGHGGKDPGTIGQNKHKEKDIALNIALKLGGYIEKNLPDVKVLYTRKDDRYVIWDDRTDLANKNKADLFVSIHVNASPSPEVYGTETWVMGLHKTESNLEVAKRENSVILLDEDSKARSEGFDPSSPESYILFSLSQSAYTESSLKLAAMIQEQFQKRVGRKNHGVKQAGFLVLWKTAMPSVLVEVGFLSNKKEEEFLASENGQDLLASGIFRAIRDYKNEVESLN